MNDGASSAISQPTKSAESAAGALLCSACGGSEYLRPYSPWHRTPICKPCFIIWYDPPENIDSTNPKEVGELSRKLKAAGKWPWTKDYAPAATPDTDPRSPLADEK